MCTVPDLAGFGICRQIHEWTLYEKWCRGHPCRGCNSVCSFIPCNPNVLYPCLYLVVDIYDIQMSSYLVRFIYANIKANVRNWASPLIL